MMPLEVPIDYWSAFGSARPSEAPITVFLMSEIAVLSLINQVLNQVPRMVICICITGDVWDAMQGGPTWRRIYHNGNIWRVLRLYAFYNVLWVHQNVQISIHSLPRSICMVFHLKINFLWVKSQTIFSFEKN